MTTRLFVTAAIALSAFVLASQALPQTVSLISPFLGKGTIAENEFVEYDADGSTVIDKYYMTTYASPGREIVISSYMPGRPIVTAIRRVIEATSFTVQPILDRFSNRRVVEREASDTFVKNGCQPGSHDAVESDTILGFPTVISRVANPSDSRMTLWYAPDLGCEVLKLTREEMRPDGSYALQVIRRTTKVQPVGN